MLKEIKISTIKDGDRHRKDMGDLRSLANSIKKEGLLQPIGVTENMELVFGERRLRAHQDILKKTTILARVVDVTSIIAGEYAENEIRKDFTPSERVAIAKAIVRKIGNRQGQRSDKQLREILPEVGTGKQTREIAADKAGFGNDRTYRQASKVVQNGTARLIHAMDSGKVSISAASILADGDFDEQEAVLELDAKAILSAAKEIRKRQTATRNDNQLKTEAKAKKSLNGKKTWSITSDQKVVPCRLVIADPPYGTTKEPWEPKVLEGFTRQWCQKWTVSDADFIVIFWSQANLWQGRAWFDESLHGYKFQQMLIWHINNAWSPKSRLRFKESWEPIFIYRRNGSTRQVLPNGRAWGDGLHNLDCFVAPVLEGNYTGDSLKQHPCQKPVALMRWLIHALTDPGEMVCSPFCGVAPCGIAAVQLGRYYHGIDTSSKFRKVAESRILTYGNNAQSPD